MGRMNWPILFLSVLLSVSAWFILYGQNIVITPPPLIVTLTKDNIVDLPSNMYIDSYPNLRVQLSGPSGLVAKAQNDPDEKLLTVDMSQARPGDQTYPVTYDKQIAKVVTGPMTVKIKVEAMVPKSVPVKVDLRGRLNNVDSSLTAYPVSETSVTVRGPRSEVAEIVEAKAILEVNQIDTRNPKPQRMPLLAFDAMGTAHSGPDITIEPDRVVITPIIGAAQVDKTVLVSATIQGSPAIGYLGESYKVNPKQIVLTGPASTLLNTSSVGTQVIDVNGLTSTKEFKVHVITPVGTTAKTSTVKVTYFVKRDPAISPLGPNASGPPSNSNSAPGVQTRRGQSP